MIPRGFGGLWFDIKLHAQKNHSVFDLIFKRIRITSLCSASPTPAVTFSSSRSEISRKIGSNALPAEVKRIPTLRRPLRGSIV